MLGPTVREQNRVVWLTQYESDRGRESYEPGGSARLRACRDTAKEPGRQIDYPNEVSEVKLK